MKNIILPFLILLYSLSTLAQPKREQIKALKVAHITTQLNLTEKEAQQFWPIYNSYEDNISKIRHEDIHKIHREIRKNSDSLTEKQADVLLNQFINAENKIHNERVQLVQKLRNVISSKKIIQLKVAEEEFNRKILERIKKRKKKGMTKKEP